jgi:serine/threonine protein kinase
VAALTPERWQEISPYLDHALSLPEEERAEWLTVFRRQRSDLADVLQELLDEHRALDRDRFLEDQPTRPATDPFLTTGESIGPYKLVSRIGEGGMGHVWLAERADGRFERQVAVKFLRLALGSRGAAERFEREGRIVGQLTHPHIAELVDAGVTPSRGPYLVLEYVKGQPIDAYCDERKLGVERRIELFLDVLDAVAYAHANLIVHRDIKPSNVFVNEANEVKLLDFGIAKLLRADTDPVIATQLTLQGGGAMTPLFAAPEQITGGAITTATDLYALGILLFLLLTGQHPGGPGPHSPADLVKAITETDAPLASAVVASANDPAMAEKHGTTPEKLRRELRGDLDTILAKALKRKPDERYASVMSFADDLRRFLRHEPISARPDAVLYRLGKYVRRHRTGVAVAALVLLLLVGFGVGQAVQLRRITRERDRANRVTEFMASMFKVSNPSEARGNSITAREILDRASNEIDTGLAKDPEIQAQMMSIMGDVYDNLGLYPRAESLLTRAVEIRLRTLGPNHPDTLNSKHLLSWVFREEGRYAEAERLQRETLDTQRRVLGPSHLNTLRSMNNIGAILVAEGRLAEAENSWREALAISRLALGSEHPATLGLMSNVAAILYEEGKLAEAENLQREALDIERRVLGSADPMTLNSINNLGLTLRREGRYADAEKLEREAVDTGVRVLGPEHPNTLSSIVSLALVLKQEGRYAEAEKLLRQALDIDRRTLGPEHPQTAECIYNLACTVALEGRRDEALSLIRQAVDHGLFPRQDVGLLQKDSDLESLHGDPRFAALVAHAKEVAASRKVH